MLYHRKSHFWQRLVALVLAAAFLPAFAFAGDLPTEPDSDLFRMYPAETRYFWNQLTDHEKQLFAILYTAIEEYQPSIRLPRNQFTVQEMGRVGFVLQEDCPELIHYKMCWYDYTPSNGKAGLVTPSYNYGADEGRWRLDIVRNKLNRLMEYIAPMEDDFERELFLYRSIITSTEYDALQVEKQEADAVFVDGRSVCAGYAASMTLACRMAGIPCFSVSGYAYLNNDPTLPRERTQENSHAWNAVQIGGNWYFVDLTWDDPLPMEGQEISDYRREYMLYMNLNEAELNSSHELDYAAYAGWILPSFHSLEESFISRKLPNSRVEGDWRDEMQAQLAGLSAMEKPRVVLIFPTVEERNAERSAATGQLRSWMKEMGWQGSYSSATFFEYPILIFDLAGMRPPK